MSDWIEADCQIISDMIDAGAATIEAMLPEDIKEPPKPAPAAQASQAEPAWPEIVPPDPPIVDDVYVGISEWMPDLASPPPPPPPDFEIDFGVNHGNFGIEFAVNDLPFAADEPTVPEASMKAPEAPAGIVIPESKEPPIREVSMGAARFEGVELPNTDAAATALYHLMNINASRGEVSDPWWLACAIYELVPCQAGLQLLSRCVGRDCSELWDRLKPQSTVRGTLANWAKWDSIGRIGTNVFDRLAVEEDAANKPIERLIQVLPRFFDGQEVTMDIVNKIEHFLEDTAIRSRGYQETHEIELIEGKYLPPYEDILALTDASTIAIYAQCGVGKGYQFHKYEGHRFKTNPLRVIGDQDEDGYKITHIYGSTDMSYLELRDKNGWLVAGTTYESSEKTARHFIQENRENKDDAKIFMVIDESQTPSTMSYRGKAGRGLLGGINLMLESGHRVAETTGTPVGLRYSILPCSAERVVVKQVKIGSVKVAIVDTEHELPNVIEAIRKHVGANVRIFVREDDRAKLDIMAQTDMFKDKSIVIHSGRRGTPEFEAFMRGELPDHIEYVLCTGVAATGTNLSPAVIGPYAMIFTQRAIVTSEDIDQGISRVRDSNTFQIPELVVLMGRIEETDSLDRIETRRYQRENFKAAIGYMMAELTRRSAKQEKIKMDDSDWKGWHVKRLSGEGSPFEIDRLSAAQATREYMRNKMTAADKVAKLATNSMSFYVDVIDLKVGTSASDFSNEVREIRRLEKAEKKEAFNASLALIREKPEVMESVLDKNTPASLKEAAKRVRQIQESPVGKEELSLETTFAVMDELNVVDLKSAKKALRTIKHHQVFQGSRRRSGVILADAERQWLAGRFQVGGIYSKADFEMAWSDLTESGTKVSHLAGDNPKHLRKLVRNMFKWKANRQRGRGDRNEEKTEILSHKLIETPMIPVISRKP